MSIFKDIIKWNKSRGLLDKKFNHNNEVAFIIEELMESYGVEDSISARDKALAITAEISKEKKDNQVAQVDAFADIIVYATGAIGKLGYDPDCVMNEVLKEINSREGTLIAGKFVKKRSEDPYVADLESCKIDN